MKVLTILGTRPEIIRLSRIIPKLDRHAEQILLHTGQNYDPLLSSVFFNELGLRSPDITVDNRGTSLSGQLGKTFEAVEAALKTHRPDRVLILGDTNSGLSAQICARMGVPVYHMEAGNRCHDTKVPEEVNRRIIDSISAVNLPYTNLSRENLLREGHHPSKIFVTGNPIAEVLEHYRSQIEDSAILNSLGLTPGQYVLVTAHRAENVDVEGRLKNIFTALDKISRDYRVVFSCHPRTREKIAKFNLDIGRDIIMDGPWGFFDFVKLEKNCRLAVTDSGTVQEEMCILGIPAITIRDTTERPETVWCGSNIVSGLGVEGIMSAYSRMLASGSHWLPPREYIRRDVSDTVLNILLSEQNLYA